MPKDPTLTRAVSAAEGTYARLRAMLVDGEFGPGARLPEAELTRLLGVSRTPLREALRRLQSDGLVMLSNRGVIVAQPSPDEIADLYGYRAVLEAFTAELVALRHRRGEIAPAQIRLLRELREDVERGRDADATASANLDLHRFIATLSDNSYAREALSRVWDIISISSAENLAEDATWRAQIDEDHREIVEAIEAGEPDRASAAARRHVLAASDVYERQHGRAD